MNTGLVLGKENRMTVYEFPFQSGKIALDYDKCQGCRSYACVKACSLFGRNLFRIQDGKPALVSAPEEAKRLCSECLTCEFYCREFGNKGLGITLDMFGLSEYRHKIGQHQPKRGE